MKRSAREFGVYLRLTKFLNDKGFQIVCASPPGGTDVRFRKCLLPRRDLLGSVKGLRDEVDLTAREEGVISLFECKPRLSGSLSVLNALGESDYAKLKRLADTISPSRLAELLRRAYGAEMPVDPRIALALAVETVDCDIPTDVTVIELGPTGGHRIWAIDPLIGRLS